MAMNKAISQDISYEESSLREYEDQIELGIEEEEEEESEGNYSEDEEEEEGNRNY